MLTKIASADELQAELKKILAYAQTENPSRKVIAQDLELLSARVAGKLPPEFLKNIKKKDDDKDDDDKD
jgi:hypothetical protein